jgi:phosphoglycolate phosphatase
MYDLDGTLVNTVEEIAYAVNMTLSQHNHEQVTIDQVEVLIGKGTGWLMWQVWPDETILKTSKAWDVIMQEFTYHYSEVVGTKSELYPHVLDTLNVIKRLGIKQAVVTNKEQPFTDQVLERTGIKSFFDLVISGNSLPVKKPDPAVIHHCLDVLKEHADTSLFVGDSSVDITVAKNAKITCWAVPYGYNNGKDIRLSEPDKLIENLSTVPSFFKGIS